MDSLLVKLTPHNFMVLALEGAHFSRDGVFHQTFSYNEDSPSMGPTGFLPRVLSLFAVSPRLGISDWSSILLISIVYRLTLCTAPSGLYLWISEMLFFLSNSLDLAHQKICLSQVFLGIGLLNLEDKNGTVSLL